MNEHASPALNIRPSRRIRVTSMLLLLGSLSACARPIPARCDGGPSAGSNFGPHTDMPRARIGSLPFPGAFTLYTDADPNGLGEHAYNAGLLAMDSDAADRGIIYTCRAGFIDMAHVRNTIDLTAYIHARVRPALGEGWGCLQFRAHEPSIYRIEFRYPLDWWLMPEDEHRRLVDELAFRISHQLALDVMAWHELLTWHGYRSTIVFSEQGSAFSYEDSPSHGLGAIVAIRALRADGDFDTAVTRILNEEIAALRPVEAEGREAAIEAINGVWWEDGEPIRRNLDIGQDDHVIEPWIVEDLSVCSSQEMGERVAFAIPTLDDVLGRSFAGLYSLTIEPRVLEADRIRECLPGSERLIAPRRDFPILLADIAEEIGEENTRP